MEIRKAKITDLQEIIDLNKIDDYWNPDEFMKDMVTKWQILIIKENDQIVWFSLFQIIWWNTPFYSLAKIHPDYQRKGLGSKLTQQLELIIKEKGFNFYCSSTTQDNKSAIGFHVKLWFQEIWLLNLPHGKEIFYRKEI